MKFKNPSLLFLLFSSLGFVACNSKPPAVPQTVAIHSPIYPKQGENITLTLFLKNKNYPTKVELSSKTRTINSSGVISAFSPETNLQTWLNPVNFPLTHPFFQVRSNELTTYKFKIIYGNQPDDYYEHEITFATNPYPFSSYPAGSEEHNQPAPVYVTGNNDHSCNVVFIPDFDLSAIEVRPTSPLIPDLWKDYFYNSVKDDILNGIYGEPFTEQFIHAYNFFINPLSGHVDLASHLFTQPVNLVNIDNFAQGKSYVHNAENREFANPSPLMKAFVNRIYNRGAFMHESGHVLYFLADEYECGVHQYDLTSPNNWLTWDQAHRDAPSYGLTDENIFHLYEPDCIASSVEVCPHAGCNNIHLLCPYEGCQMGMGGLSIIPYGKPCKKAIERWLNFYTY